MASTSPVLPSLAFVELPDGSEVRRIPRERKPFFWRPEAAASSTTKASTGDSAQQFQTLGTPGRRIPMNPPAYRYPFGQIRKQHRAYSLVAQSDISHGQDQDGRGVAAGGRFSCPISWLLVATSGCAVFWFALTGV